MTSLRQLAVRGLLFVVLFLLVLPLLCSAQDDQLCTDPVSECDVDTDYFPEKVVITHANATITNIEYSNTYVDFTVVDPSVDDASWSYRVVHCGCEEGEVDKGVQILFTKPSRLLVSEGPTLSLMDDLLPDLEPLAYVGDSRYIYNQDVLSRVEAESTVSLQSMDSGLDFSPLRDDDKFSVSLIGVYEVDNFVNQETGKKYLVIAEAKEISPLARAEWMKVIGMLFGLTKDADEKFTEIEKQYNAIKEKAKGASRWPSVFFNSPILRLKVYDPDASADENFEWSQPTQNSYTTAFVKDANADYRFGFDGKNGNLGLTFTEMRGNFSSARFLVNTGTAPVSNEATLKEFIEDPITPKAKDDDSFEKLAKELTSVRCGNVWSNQKRIRGQASDYFESLAFRPHVFLNDLVDIFHPYLNLAEDKDLEYSYNLGVASQELVGSKCPFADLSGDAPKGKKYVDHNFTVPKLNRFEIEDQAEEKVLPGLREKLELDDQSMELFFTTPHDGDSKDTPITVRLAVNEADVEKYENSTDMLASLRSTLGEDVTVTAVVEEPATNTSKEDDGGLGGGAIFGIVVACLVVVAVIAFFVIRSRRGRRGRIGVAGEPEDSWADPDAGLVGQGESMPIAAV